MTSTNQLNFWKASSQSPITSSSAASSVSASETSVKKRCQHFTNCILNAFKLIKWPLAILVASASIGALVYFLLIQSDMLDHRQPNADGVSPSIRMPVTFDDGSDYLQQQERTAINYLNKYNSINRNKSNQSSVGGGGDNRTHEAGNRTAAANNGGGDAIAPKSPSPAGNRLAEHTGAEQQAKAPKHTTVLVNANGDDDAENVVERSRLLFPTKETLQQFGFTSGHQNNFGVPIEEDERILRMLNDQMLHSQERTTKGGRPPFSTSTDASSYQTRVSPTLPILAKIASTTERLRLNATEDGD